MVSGRFLKVDLSKRMDILIQVLSFRFSDSQSRGEKNAGRGRRQRSVERDKDLGIGGNKKEEREQRRKEGKGIKDSEINGRAQKGASCFWAGSRLSGDPCAR